MVSELIHTAAGNIWIAFLVILFFGGSIFVHELGHFLAARRRGVHVERFSIGIGPAIWSHRAKDGVEYRLSWLPLGGYVLLPQLAELSMVEGKSETREAEFAGSSSGLSAVGAGDSAPLLPPVDYVSKMIVFAAGAAFNILFAFALACILTVIGVPERSDTASTRIGYVSANLELADGAKVPSPAQAAGLQVGDQIKAIDGESISNWGDVRQTLESGSGRGPGGEPRAVFDILRGTKELIITVSPRIAGDEKYRQVGILPAFSLIVYEVSPHSRAEFAGFQAGDEVRALDGVTMLNNYAFAEYLDAHRSGPIAAAVHRADRDMTLTIPAAPAAKPDSDFGLGFSTGYHLTHPSPLRQLWEPVLMTVRTLAGLINPRSDIGLSKLAGPVGIVHMFIGAAQAGLRTVFLFTILLNVNLAIINLLPIPVLDGGQIAFATVSKIRGRPLPLNFILATQSVFVVLILSVIAYVSIFNVRQWARDAALDRIQASAKP